MKHGKFLIGCIGNILFFQTLKINSKFSSDFISSSGIIFRPTSDPALLDLNRPMIWMDSLSNKPSYPVTSLCCDFENGMMQYQRLKAGLIEWDEYMNINCGNNISYNRGEVLGTNINTVNLDLLNIEVTFYYCAYFLIMDIVSMNIERVDNRELAFADGWTVRTDYYPALDLTGKSIYLFGNIPKRNNIVGVLQSKDRPILSKYKKTIVDITKVLQMWDIDPSYSTDYKQFSRKINVEIITM